MNQPLQFPLNANRHASFTTAIRRLLATTAAFWMGPAQSNVSTTLQQRATTNTSIRHQPGAHRLD